MADKITVKMSQVGPTDPTSDLIFVCIRPKCDAQTVMAISQMLGGQPPEMQEQDPAAGCYDIAVGQKYLQQLETEGFLELKVKVNGKTYKVDAEMP